jgi:AraC-like DNA-binding protein
MILSDNVITFRGMPLFQKTRFHTPMTMEGTMENLACFFYIVEGAMESNDSRGVHRIGEKEALAKNCGSYVQTFLSSATSESCEAIAVYLHQDILREIYKDEVPRFLKKDGSKPPEKFVGNDLIDQYMANLFIYFDNPEALDEELGIIKLKELVLILLKSERYLDVQNLLSELFTPISVEFKQAVENNLLNAISMERLAFICNMSLSTFKREFRKVYAESPARYIKTRRLEHAASLLLCNGESVADVAFDSGFQDVTTFSASFQDYFHTTPSKYRLVQNRK